MDGYYDPHPLVRLERPIVVAGYLADDTRAVAYPVSCLLGLPFADVDRKVEHTAGRSIWRLVDDEGEAAYRRLEATALRRELAATPPAIVAAGDAALVDPESRRAALARADVVFLELDLAGCYWRLQQRGAGDALAWHPLHRGPLLSLDALRPYVDRRRRALEESPHRVPLAGHGVAGAVDALKELVERLSRPA